MPSIVIGAELRGTRAFFRSLGTTRSAIQKEALIATVEHWHRKILVSAFTPGNERRKPISPRTTWYMQNRKRTGGVGQGKYVAERFSGRTARSVRYRGKVTGTSGRARFRAPVPKYFTDPYIGTYRDQRGRLRRITQQPDKEQEVMTMTRADVKEVREQYGKEVNRIIRRQMRSSRP